jgi:hydrogenase expression/formation protein HypE
MDRPLCIKAVLFDFDGTLTEPGSLDFTAVRKAVGCRPDQAVLEFISGLKDELARRNAMETLDRFEVEAAVRSRPNAGAEDLVLYLRDRALKVGILSRNSLRAIEIALGNFAIIRPAHFDVILSRDDPYPPKPCPDGIRAAALKMGVTQHQVLVIGDYLFDIEAGYQAGACTAFLTNRGTLTCSQPQPDFTIDRLEEAKGIVALHSPLHTGKLPNQLLRGFLEELIPPDPPFLLGPGVGEDVAAVGIEGEEVLVLKSDPVTFVADSIGHYAVTVNANDIATCGAKPRWLLSTLLFPPGSTAFQIGQVMQELGRVAGLQGMIVCGGHTEVTDAVTRPVVVCQVAGTVARGRLIDKRNIAEGDLILVTKAVALEGSAIIAREFAAELDRCGVPAEVIHRCREFLTDPGISVVEEAMVAAEFSGVTGMHDVTEGGIATALEEIGYASRHRIAVNPGAIPVLEETRIICSALGLDPLGLIGSGSLLIVCGPQAGDSLVPCLRQAGIDVTRIGEVLGRGEGVVTGGGRPWVSFPVDELTRLFAGSA